MNVLEWARAQWDRVLAGALFLAGGLAVLAGWAGVREEALTAAQIPYVISGGLGGISMIGVGAVFWLSADLRDEWRKLDDLDAAPAPQEPTEVVAATNGVGANGSSAAPPAIGTARPRQVRARPIKAGAGDAR